jgi:hypothetical protein
MFPIFALVIVVHVTNLIAPPALLREAQKRVSAMFLGAGIVIAWVDDRRGGAHVETRLIITPRAEGSMDRGFNSALGAASRTPAGVDTAWVFYSRVSKYSERNHVRLEQLLACAIAHELGHVVQRMPSHSRRGLMRAAWGPAEYRDARLGRLKFVEH